MTAIVIGAGTAGMLVALHLRRAGAEVRIVEAGDAAAIGGDAAFGDAQLRFCHDGALDLAGLCGEPTGGHRPAVDAYPAGAFAADVAATGGAPVHAEVLARESRPAVDELVALGMPLRMRTGDLPAGVTELPAGHACRVRGGGRGLADWLRTRLEALGVVVETGVRASGLLVEAGRVRGARLRRGPAGRARPGTRPAGGVEAPGRVILACGGYQGSAALRRRWLGPVHAALPLRGTPYNDGRMLLAALAAGAHLTGPAAAQLGVVDGVARRSALTRLAVGELLLDGPDPPWVDRSRPGEVAHQLASALAAAPPGIGFHLVPVEEQASLPERHRGAPHGGVRLRRTADGVQVEPTFRQQPRAPAWRAWDRVVARYPAAVRGLAARGSDWLVWPVRPVVLFTLNGLSTDVHGRVLRMDGEPVSGLWAIGEVTGDAFGSSCPVGSGLMRNIVFARRVAASVVRQEGDHDG